MIAEKSVQSYFLKLCRLSKIIAFKLDITAYKGCPDVIVILNGEIVFIEFKRPKKHVVSKYQKIFHEYLTNLGHKVYIIKNKEEVCDFAKKHGII